jgi:hypothetical protein
MAKLQHVWRGPSPETAERTAGYAKSGLSIYTRAIAHGPQPQLSSGRHQPRISGGRERTLSEKIEYERQRLLHAEAQLRIEDNAERRAKLETSIDIKAAYLARLIAEQQNGELT